MITATTTKLALLAASFLQYIFFSSCSASFIHVDRQYLTNNYNKVKINLNGWFDNLFPTPIDDESSISDRQLQYPEQYRATYELLEPNHPVSPGDDDDDDATKIARPLLKQTQLEQRAITMAYNAVRDGWTPAAFHKAVDGKGAAVVIARTDDGTVVGGYNPKGWASLGGARPSVAAFLFYQTSTMTSCQKLQKVGGGGLACARDEFDFGISLGPDGLVIGLQSGREQWAQSKLGTYYERGPEDLPSLFTGGGCYLDDLKVFVGRYDEGEDIPYSGAVFDMTSG